MFSGQRDGQVFFSGRGLHVGNDGEGESPDLKPAAFTALALNRDGAAHKFYQAFDDGQTKSGTKPDRIAVCIFLFKRLEEFFLESFIDTDAVIRHRDIQF